MIVRRGLPLIAAAVVAALAPTAAGARPHPAFSPVQIRNLVLWLDAADQSTLVVSGGKVTQWNDKSSAGNAVVQSNSSAQPAVVPSGINGLGNVAFDGAADYMLSTNQSFSTSVYPESTAFVVQIGALNSGDNPGAVLWTAGATGGYPRWGYGLPSSDVAKFFFGGQNDQLSYPQSIDITQPAIFDAGESVTSQQGFANYDGAPVASISGSITGDTGSWPLSVGGRYQTTPPQATNFDPSQVAEILVYHRLLRPFEYQEIEGYLACKWGLQAQLPSNHPYRYACPPVLNVVPSGLKFATPHSAAKKAQISGGLQPYAASGCSGVAALAVSGATLTLTPAGSGNCSVTLADSSTPPNAATLGVSVGGGTPSVATYHYDSLRTGWNASETTLTPGLVQGGSFGQIASVALDDQVDAQPLLVAGEQVTGAGTHDVLYVATEGNTVYGIDAATGTVLLQRNLGSPVPEAQLPGQCNNNGPNVGINSTPVIDLRRNVMYAIVYTFENGASVYRIHALNLADLSDSLPPVQVSARRKLNNGSVYTFQAHYSRQRPALLLANDTVYAGFGSFCDISADQSRGWLLGWRAGTLQPLPVNQLDDRLATSPNSFFLASIWMSGYGLAADSTGIYYATGNSDPSGNTYDGVYNIQESVVRQSADLSKVLDIFTPYNVGYLDVHDQDLASGGVLLLPDQPGSIPHLAAAAGKSGTMYMLNRDHLGGYTAGGPDNVLASLNITSCWCGQTYFQGSDGAGRIVSSGGNRAIVWEVVTQPPLSFTQVAQSAQLPSGQDGGFFTTVSSNGVQAGTAILWAVTRPTSVPGAVGLYAIDPGSGATLFSAAAGTWIDGNGNADVVPVVAGGRVYVASYQQLAIFGITQRAPARARR